MSSLLRLSFEGMVFAWMLPWFWGGVLVAVIAAWWSVRRNARGLVRPAARWSELLLPFGFPVAIVLWSSAFYGSLEGTRTPGWYWQELGIYAIVLMQAVTVAWLVTRHRARLTLVFTLSLVAIWWACGASFAGGMAVYNDWL